MSIITRTVKVQIQKELTISLPEEYASQTNIEQWSNFLWAINNVDDVFTYVAELAATGGAGASWDGIGELVEVEPGKFTDDSVCFAENSIEVKLELLPGTDNE